MEFSFSKNQRLLKSADFKSVKTKPFFKSHDVKVVVQKNNGQKSRLGLVVPKKAGNAVIRNSIKRYIREQFRLSNITSSCYDIIFIVFNKKSDDHHKKLVNNIFLKLESEL